MRGLVDIIHKKAYYFDGQNGENIREEPVPAELVGLMEEKRRELISELSNLDSELEELFLEEKDPAVEMLEKKIRDLTISRKFIPVFMGSAYKNKGVQLALDGVLKFLPSPPEVTNLGYVVTADKQ
jgi:elongation factor G